LLCRARLGKIREMAVRRRIRRRLALAIVLTALIPVLVAIWWAAATVRTAAARFYLPDIGVHLDRSLGLYQELARTVKAQMRQEAATMAERESLRAAVRTADRPRIERELRVAFREHPSLVTLAARDAGGRELWRIERERPLDPAHENRLEVVRPLAEGEEDEVPSLLAVFAASRARFDELSEMSQFLDTYRKIEHRREADEKGYVLAFVALLGLTIVAAVGAGSLLARSVSGRVTELAEATKLVADGDLSIRVPERGDDELADLARSFNRMLGEVAESRSRIEYLQRIGAWQDMARRLAHEIKNPLTPIQLAVQEVHRRYEGSEPAFRKLIDTTLEIVEDEVGTLRRLVSEFSDFARLPQANLQTEDLAEFLRELSEQLLLLEDERGDGELPDGLRSAWRGAHIGLTFNLPKERAEVLMDRHMLRRVMLNLIQNSAQAMREKGERAPKIVVSLRADRDSYLLDVEDSGPGIPEVLRERMFDPYVTTKSEGTGLGLAIVKKVIVEHGGSISAQSSELGGALLRIRLPARGSRLAELARTRIERLGESQDEGTGALP
jgi:nitrogen fixation/metabolism regulation signal transduction histidine kinase